MPVRFECPHCNVRLSISNRARLLKPVVCPACKSRFQARVPQEAQPATRVVARPVNAPQDDGDSDSQFLTKESRHEEIGAAPREQLFYKLDSSKISLREYWWGSPLNPLVLVIAWLVKLLRIQVPSSSDDPPVKSLAPFEALFQEIPVDVRGEFRPLVVELQRLGFVNPVCHVIHDGHHKTAIHWLSLRHGSGAHSCAASAGIGKRPAVRGSISIPPSSPPFATERT